MYGHVPYGDPLFTGMVPYRTLSCSAWDRLFFLKLFLYLHKTYNTLQLHVALMIYDPMMSMMQSYHNIIYF